MAALMLLVKVVLLALTGYSAAQLREPWTFNLNRTSAESIEFEIKEPANDSLHQRTRRETFYKSCCYSVEERKLVLQKHNEYRSMQGASDMELMEWNMDLQKLAQSYANKCRFTHSSRSLRQNYAGFQQIGENLAAHSGAKVSITNPVESWYNEVDDYDYRSRTCAPGKMCGHYTQVVWYNSKFLGCGYKFCKNLMNAPGINSGLLIVCNYGPAGNYLGVHPFRKGKACAGCDKSEFPYCLKNMCSSRSEEELSAEEKSASSSSFPAPGILWLFLTSLATRISSI